MRTTKGLYRATEEFKVLTLAGEYLFFEKGDMLTFEDFERYENTSDEILRCEMGWYEKYLREGKLNLDPAATKRFNQKGQGLGAPTPGEIGGLAFPG